MYTFTFYIDKEVYPDFSFKIPNILAQFSIYFIELALAANIA